MTMPETPERHDLDLARRLDRACNQFEGAWRAGRPRIEDYLVGWQGEERAALLRELVPLDIDYRRRAGEACAAKDYGEFVELDAEWLAETLGQTPSLFSNSTSDLHSPRKESTQGHMAVGSVVGDHELLEEIGRGGMGVVYRAWDRRLKRPVALKMIRSGQVASADELRRFRAEAELSATLDHPNIVPMYEVGEEDEQPFFSMKLIEGGSLTQHLNRYRDDVRATAELMATVAGAVHHAHQRGILHRDLKPGNILLDTQGEPHVADFGLARHMESDAWQTQSGALVGTPSYMAPEQAAGKSSQLTTAADVYALGAVLYECLTGKPPFVGETALDTLVKVQTDEPVAPSRLRPGVPRDLEVICLKCLSKEPRARYASAEALAEDLQRWTAGEPIEARAVTGLERAWRWARRRPAAAGLLAVSVVASLALVGVAVGLAYSTRLARSNDALQQTQEELEATNGDLEEAMGKLKEEKGKLKEEKEESERQRQRANRLLYVSQINLAGQARKEGKIAHALRQLEVIHPKGSTDEDLRGPEWYALWDQCQGYDRVIPAHLTRLEHLSLSHDGRWLASCGADKRIKVWDTREDRCVMDQAAPDRDILTMRVSPTGQTLGLLLSDGGTDGWDLGGLRPRRWTRPLVGEAAAVKKDLLEQWGTRFGDRRRLAKSAGSLSVDVATRVGMLVGPPAGPGMAFAAWIRWESRFDSVTSDGQVGAVRREIRDKEEIRHVEVEVYELAGDQPKALTKIIPSGEYPRSVEFTPDGEYLALVATETVHLYPVGKLLTGNQDRRAFHTLSMVHATAFSADGRYFAAGGGDGRIRIWDLVRGTGKVRMQGNKGGTGVAFSPDGRFLGAFWSGTFTVFEAKNGQQHFKREYFNTGGGLFSRGAFHPSMTTCYAGGTIWKVADGTKQAKVPLLGHSLGDAYSPEGRYLALANVGVLKIVDARSGQILRTIPRPKEMLTWVTCVDFSPDGRWLAAGSASQSGFKTGSIVIWDTSTWQPVTRLDSHRFSVWRVKYSPDGRYLAAACGAYHTPNIKGGEVKIWDFASGQEILTLGGHTECAFDLCFSPDSRRLASVSGHSLNGRLPGELKIWDLTYGQELLTIKDHPGMISGVAFSPDGKSLASISWDGTVIVRGGPTRAWRDTEPWASQPLNRPRVVPNK